VVCATAVADSRERVGAVATPIVTFFAYKETLTLKNFVFPTIRMLFNDHSSTPLQIANTKRAYSSLCAFVIHDDGDDTLHSAHHSHAFFEISEFATVLNIPERRRLANIYWRRGAIEVFCTPDA